MSQSKLPFRHARDLARRNHSRSGTYRPVGSGEGREIRSTDSSNISVDIPEQYGFIQRPPEVLRETIRPNRLLEIRRAVVHPGGIICTRDGVHPESFRTERVETSRHLKVRERGGSHYARLAGQDWGKPATSLPRGYFLDGEYFGYGHFLLEILSRLWPIVLEPALRDAVLLIPGTSPPYVYELLSKLGFPAQNLLPVGEPVLVKSLLVASQSYLLGRGFTEEARAFYALLREQLTVVDAPRKIYLSRRDFPSKVGRVLLEESKVRKLLEYEGFKTVNPHQLSVTEQMELVFSADHLASEAGTIAFNRVFQNLDGRQLLFGPSEGIEVDHFLLAEMIGHGRATVINGRSLEPDKHPFQSNWSIDVDFLGRALSAP